jgi:hypothetical protein
MNLTCRMLGALEEWRQLRARVREERQFHLDRATADLRALGLSPRAAKKAARDRFGGRRNRRIALAEIGGDMKGLAWLLRAHRVLASAWSQPITLLAAISLLFILSPAPREMLEGLLGQTLGSVDRGVISLAVMPGIGDITRLEFEALRSMTTVTGVEWYGAHNVRAVARPGVTRTMIEADAIARTGNRGIYGAWVSDQTYIATGPVKVVWLFIAVYGLFFMHAHVWQPAHWKWLLYGLGVACLHLLASLTAWALVIQICGVTAGLALPALVIAYSAIAMMLQCRYWWLDLRQRCPVCLDCLVMPLKEGTADRVLLEAPVTESVCVHGHGVLVESRWARQFRGEIPACSGFG